MEELAELVHDPVFYGSGLPRGDGKVVLVLPGLFGNDLYLHPLHQWLRRLGYRPHRSTLAVNAGCPDRLRTQVEASLRRAMRNRPGRVALVGHSRGGMLAWALASRMQNEVSHLALLGSPAPMLVRALREGLSYPPPGVAASPVAQAGARAMKLLDPDCKMPACECAYPQDVRRPLSPDTRVLAIHSRDDQVVTPKASIVEDTINPGAGNIEVSGTHSGLIFNRAVYRHLADFLSS
jgi:pimeloyl-ACP methyl ester carboxylesterase